MLCGRQTTIIPQGFDMIEDFSQVAAGSVEEAKAEMLRASEAWKATGYEEIDKSLRDEKARKVNHLEGLHEEWKGERDFLKEEICRQQTQLVSLEIDLASWKRYRDPSRAVWITTLGLVICNLLGLCAGAIASHAVFGLMFAGMTACLTIPPILVWFSLRKRKAEAQINYLDDELSILSVQLSTLDRELVHAVQKTKTIGQRWDDAYQEYEHLEYVCSLKANAVKAQKRYEALIRAAESRQWQLLHRDWRELRGIPFEDYLQEVFEMLGYCVKRTKKARDQGLDLILTGKGRMIGVQCKGYQGSVGDDAVQQAHAGKGYYSCDCCVVITNSYFSPDARSLASRLGCILISGAQIPDLINAKIHL